MVDSINHFCIDHGSGGVVIDDSVAHAVRITAYFPTPQWPAVKRSLDRYLDDLREIFSELPPPSVSTAQIPHEDWATAWKSNFKPMELGDRLIVTPPWLHPELQGRIPILIEPAEAFGTGTHETTQGCLVLLEDALERLCAKESAVDILDVGCGSGILAIAGKKLGASHVIGVDNDPLAIDSARRNAVLNGVQDTVEFANMPLVNCSHTATIVLANLDPMTLLANRDKLASLFSHFLVVSGVPLDQWSQVKDLFQSAISSLRREITRSEWGCGLFEKSF
jgi:ribosomal protein L11 methyltransferase